MVSDAISVTRPLIISILLVCIIFLMLSCIRKRRLMMALQEQAIREHEAAELGAVSRSQSYMFQYAPPPAPVPNGSTYSNGHSTHHTSLYAPPLGSSMSMVPLPQAHMYPPMSSTTTTVEQSQQNGAPGSTYILAQDGADDVPSIPPPPYTPQLLYIFMTGNHSSLSEEHLSGDTRNLRSRHAASSSSSSASTSSTQTYHSNDTPRGTSTANQLHSSLQNEYSQTVQERHDPTLLDKDNNHSHLTGQDASQSQTLTKPSTKASSVETPTTHHSTIPTPTSSPLTTISHSESNLRDILGDSPTLELEKRTGKQLEQDSEHGEFSCNICFDTSMSPVLTLCGHLFCWSCLHQWLEAQHQNPTCPVCKAGCAQDKVIPIYGRGKEQLDPRSTTPKRPAGQRPEQFRNPGQAGFAMAPGQVTFSGTMLPAFMFSPFGVQYGGSYTGTIGGNGAAQTPMQAYMSRMFFMLGTMILVGILLY